MSSGWGNDPGPTPDGWRDGDRGFTCYVARADGQKMTKTIRGAGST